jgi:hypothetical protein
MLPASALHVHAATYGDTDGYNWATIGGVDYLELKDGSVNLTNLYTMFKEKGYATPAIETYGTVPVVKITGGGYQYKGDDNSTQYVGQNGSGTAAVIGHGVKYSVYSYVTGGFNPSKYGWNTSCGSFKGVHYHDIKVTINSEVEGVTVTLTGADDVSKSNLANGATFVTYNNGYNNGGLQLDTDGKVAYVVNFPTGVEPSKYAVSMESASGSASGAQGNIALGASGTLTLTISDNTGTVNVGEYTNGAVYIGSAKIDSDVHATPEAGKNVVLKADPNDGYYVSNKTLHF